MLTASNNVERELILRQVAANAKSEAYLAWMPDHCGHSLLAANETPASTDYQSNELLDSAVLALLESSRMCHVD